MKVTIAFGCWKKRKKNLLFNWSSCATTYSTNKKKNGWKEAKAAVTNDWPVKHRMDVRPTNEKEIHIQKKKPKQKWTNDS